MSTRTSGFFIAITAASVFSTAFRTGRCLSTSRNPITASSRTWKMSSIPAACILSPPMPKTSTDGSFAFSSRTTPDPWRSPEASPAITRIFLTGSDHPADDKRRGQEHDGLERPPLRTEPPRPAQDRLRIRPGPGTASDVGTKRGTAAA